MSAGQRVQAGEQIATVGNRGYSTGPHLHYEVYIHGKPMNAMTLKLPTGRKLEGEQLEAFMAERAASKIPDVPEDTPKRNIASVAVIGASDRPHSVGAVVLRNVLDGGFGGPVYAVNPAHRELAGRADKSSECRRDALARRIAPLGWHLQVNGTADRLLAVADKLDTVAGCFAIGQIPSGSKDPLALRRAGGHGRQGRRGAHATRNPQPARAGRLTRWRTGCTR